MLDLSTRFRGAHLRRIAARKPARRLPALATAAAVAVVFSVLSAPVARADQTATCWQLGYGCIPASAGYFGQPPSDWPNQQWLNSAGNYWSAASVYNGGHHNCTLYAAYREALNGVPDPGNLGDAAQWAGTARAEGIQVDQTPAVGAIADWTTPNSSMGTDLQGHVAYVEKVTPAYIETSEDNFGRNTTGYRHIPINSPSWPNYFIHFQPSPAGGWGALTGLSLYHQAAGDSYVELPNGSGGWTSVKGPQFSADWNFYPANLNGDGVTDLFLYNPTNGDSYVEFGNGSGSWTGGVAGPHFATGWQIYPAVLNGTGGGLTDLFLYNPSNGDSYVEFANGHGGWSGVAGPHFAPGWHFYPGNLNGDLLTDFFLYNPSNGDSYVERANGSGGWSGVAGPHFAPGWNIYPGNLDGDGLTDLFLYNPSNGDSYVEFADGSGGWTGGVPGPQFGAGWTVYPGNFTSDGLTGMFLYNASTGASSVELADGAGDWTGVGGPQFAPGWDFYPVNLNGDGLTDFFLYNPAHGTSWTELADGFGDWTGGRQGPQFAADWTVNPGQLG